MARTKKKEVQAVNPLELQVLIKKRDELVERLETGAVKIEEARSQGRDVTSWEDYWIQLLHEYESACDKIRKYKYES